MNKKDQKKIEVLRCIHRLGRASQQDIANEIAVSIPVVIGVVKDLLAVGIIENDGMLESTGGRKAKAFRLNPHYRYAVGVEVKPQSMSLMLFNFAGEGIAWDSCDINTENKDLFFKKLGALVGDFIHCNRVDEDKLLGVGIAIPGAVEQGGERINNDYVLGLYNVHRNIFCQAIPYNCILANNSDAAGYAEIKSRNDLKSMVYLHLCEQVGAAIILCGVLYEGQRKHGGKLNHVILEPGGKKCFCGRNGCATMYCSIEAIEQEAGCDIKEFFTRLRNGDERCDQIWDKYLEYLAIMVNNVVLIFDCSVVIGGTISVYFDDYYQRFLEKLKLVSCGAVEESYVQCSVNRTNIVERGMALLLINDYIENKFR